MSLCSRESWVLRVSISVVLRTSNRLFQALLATGVRQLHQATIVTKITVQERSNIFSQGLALPAGSLCV